MSDRRVTTSRVHWHETPCGKRLAHAPGRFVGGRPGADGAKTPFELSTHFTHRCRSLILLLSSLVVVVWFSLTIVFQSLAGSLYCNVQTEKRIVCCENGNFPLDMDALCGMCRYSSTSIYMYMYIYTYTYAHVIHTSSTGHWPLPSYFYSLNYATGAKYPTLKLLIRFFKRFFFTFLLF